MLRWFIAAVVLYGGFVALLLYMAQGLLQYFPERRRTSPSAVDLAEAEEMVLNTSDGERVIVWHVPPRGEQPVFLYFHGNGGSLCWRAERFRALIVDGSGLIALSYRGYGGSSGRPTKNWSDRGCGRCLCLCRRPLFCRAHHLVGRIAWLSSRNRTGSRQTCWATRAGGSVHLSGRCRSSWRPSIELRTLWSKMSPRLRRPCSSSAPLPDAPQPKPQEEMKVERPPDEAPAEVPLPVEKPPEKVQNSPPPAPVTAQQIQRRAPKVEASLQTNLMRQLQRSKRYPASAQAHKEEGVVLLSFESRP